MPNDVTFHDYAETYPLLEGEEYEAFKADVAIRGVREAVKYRLVNGKKEYLDGRNRLRACADLGIPCPEEEVSVEDADVEAFIDSLNLHRRHLTREQRQDRVLRLRERGHSLRQIADAVGVSAATVFKDIKDAEGSAGVQNRTPGEGRPSTMSAKPIAGKDGKNYASRKPRKQKAKPCERCYRMGTPGCDACRKAFPDGFPRREPGEDDDEIGSGRGPKNGRPKHDFKATDALLGQLVRAFEECGKAYGRGNRYRTIDARMADVAKEWNDWWKECTNA
jgi:transposase